MLSNRRRKHQELPVSLRGSNNRCDGGDVILAQEVIGFVNDDDFQRVGGDFASRDQLKDSAGCADE